MPLILKENIEDGAIGLWKVSETTAELYNLANLSPEDETTYSGISAPHRQKEWLATRALLNTLIPYPPLIKYHIDGRPFLENNTTNISISHSTGYIAVFLHSTSIPGIDIELIARQVGRVASRFLSTDEMTACQAIPGRLNFRMLLHWCAKEAIFKMVPLSNIEFATDIAILIPESFDDSGTFEGAFHHKTGPVPMLLNYKIENEVLMVWGHVKEYLFI